MRKYILILRNTKFRRKEEGKELKETDRKKQSKRKKSRHIPMKGENPTQLNPLYKAKSY
jgi:hypothetical protein